MLGSRTDAIFASKTSWKCGRPSVQTASRATKCGQKVAESLLDEHRRTPGKIQENPRTRHRVHQEEEASLGS